MRKCSMCLTGLLLLICALPMGGATTNEWGQRVLRPDWLIPVEGAYIVIPTNEFGIPYTLQKGDLIELDVLIPIAGDSISFSFSVESPKILAKGNPYKQEVQTVSYTSWVHVAHYFKAKKAGTGLINLTLNGQVYSYEIYVMP